MHCSSDWTKPNAISFSPRKQSEIDYYDDPMVKNSHDSDDGNILYQSSNGNKDRVDSVDYSATVGCVLEHNSRLSHSLIWSWLRDFYSTHGITAWSRGIVAHFVTTNCCIAKMYAQCILGFLRDFYRPSIYGQSTDLNVDLSSPIFIVEIGSGHGKFAFLVLQKLLELKEYFPPTKCDGMPFKYIITDFTESNVKFCLNHKSFKTFIEMGIVDFATMDAENDTELDLIISKEHINRYTNINPVIIVANYVLHALPHDAFRIVNDSLQESLVTIMTEESFEPDIYDPELIKRFKRQWIHNNVPIQQDSVNSQQNIIDYYSGSQADMNIILSYMLDQFNGQDASVLLPVGGISSIRNWLHITSNRLIFLTGDKGYNHKSEYSGLREPHIAIHGSFSLEVNYDAIRLYIESKGGFALQSPYLNEHFKVSCFVVGAPKSDLVEGCSAFQSSMRVFGPDAFRALQRGIKDETPHPSPKHVIALLRLSDHDPDVLWKFQDALLDKLTYPYAANNMHTAYKMQKDIRMDLDRVYSCYYPLTKDRDIAFLIGRLCVSMKDYEGGLLYFNHSLSDCGPHSATHYNLGLCHQHLDHIDEAIICMEQSLKLKPEYSDAIEALEQLNAKKKQNANKNHNNDHIQNQQKLNQSTSTLPSPSPSPPMAKLDKVLHANTNNNIIK